MSAHMMPRLACDQPGCYAVFVGKLDKSITSTREEAAAGDCGWRKVVEPARILDFCWMHPGPKAEAA